MNITVRYQVFLSSTYDDLRVERQQATQAILEAGHFPSGMELFPASDDTQWELIKRVIEESDYYVVIVAGKYGSIGPLGISYTEMEYDFAVEQEIPVLGFVKDDIDSIPSKFVERDLEKRAKLESFRAKVLSRTCRKFDDPLGLGMAVIKSIMYETRVRPRVGWVRADNARTEDDQNRERDLQSKLSQAEESIEELMRMVRDGRVLASEIDISQISQESDLFEFTVFYRDGAKNYVSEVVQMSWDDIFRTIGPTMYGYILRKSGAEDEYSFEENISNAIRSKIYDRVESRKITIQQGQIDACVMQFKELGYVEYSEKKQENGGVFRGICLSEAGERYLAKLIAQVR